MMFLFFWAPLGIIALMQLEVIRTTMPEEYENYIVWVLCAWLGIHRLFNFEGMH